MLAHFLSSSSKATYNVARRTIKNWFHMKDRFCHGEKITNVIATLYLAILTVLS